jgi:hypothetical protein
MTNKPAWRDPKYSGWPGPEPVEAEITPHGVPHSEPKPKKKKPVEEVVE